MILTVNYSKPVDAVFIHPPLSEFSLLSDDQQILGCVKVAYQLHNHNRSANTTRLEFESIELDSFDIKYMKDLEDTS